MAITIVLYQAWLMPFFQPFFAGREALARVVFYALYGSLLLTAAILFGTRADIRRTVMPLAVVSAAIVAATALHPIGMVTRDYIIAIGMGGAAVVLMQGSAPAAVLRLSAAVTVLNAALCFVDLLFADAAEAGRHEQDQHLRLHQRKPGLVAAEGTELLGMRSQLGAVHPGQEGTAEVAPGRHDGAVHRLLVFVQPVHVGQGKA